MNETRAALLIACSEYQESAFHPLPESVRDVDGLRRVLTEPTIGDFTVTTVLNERSETVREQIEGFFAERTPDDFLLLYFSCHGVLDSTGQLHFTTVNTKERLLNATGIAASWVKERMDQSRSQRVVLLLDCCYSGLFGTGSRRGSADVRELHEQLGGRGRVVITASDKMEYAHGSAFTDAVVHGLETGEADLDDDGWVSVHELYQYVHDQVCQNTLPQTPTMSADRVRGRICIARNPNALLPLPDELEQVVKSESAWQRLWAIDGLQRLLADAEPEGRKRAARKALAHLRDNDTDRGVRAAADTALRRASRRRRLTALRELSARPWVTRPRVVAAGLVLVVVSGAAIWGMSIAFDRECTPNARPANGVLSIGTLLPRTGEFVYSGPALDAGVDLAIQDITEAGPLPGIAVRFEETNRRDEGSPSADTAVRSTDELLQGGVDVIIGPATSQVAREVIDTVICAGVIMFAPSNTSPFFTTYPDHGRYFRTAPLSSLEGAVLGNLVIDDGNETVVLISRDDQYGNDLREETGKAIEKAGGQVLDSFGYDPSAPHTVDIRRIKDKDPDAIVLLGFTESAQILKLMIQEGLGPNGKRVYGSGANMTNTLAGQVSPQDPGVLAGMRGIPLDTGNESFVKRLTEANPGLRDLLYAAQAYDAAVITVLAAAVAGTDEPGAVAREINGVTKTGEKCTDFAGCLTLVKEGRNIDYDGPSGPLEFADAGEPPSGTYMISEIQTDGTVKALWSVEVGVDTEPVIRRPGM